MKEHSLGKQSRQRASRPKRKAVTGALIFIPVISSRVSDGSEEAVLSCYGALCCAGASCLVHDGRQFCSGSRWSSKSADSDVCIAGLFCGTNRAALER